MLDTLKSYYYLFTKRNHKKKNLRRKYRKHLGMAKGFYSMKTKEMSLLPGAQGCSDVAQPSLLSSWRWWGYSGVVSRERPKH